jgi:zinc protease
MTLAVLITGLLFAAPVPMPALHIEEYRLENGLRVVLQPNPDDDLVAVNVRYNVGSVHEVEGKRGLAHVVEHMMFDDGVDGDFSHELAPLGAPSFNAHTTLDHTEYEEVVPPESLELVLWLEAQRMAGLRVNPAHLEREKRVVEHEVMERRYDSPHGLFLAEVLSGLFPKPHPLNVGPSGFIEDIRGMTPEDVTEFHTRNYGPNRASLVVTGRFSIQEAKAAIARHLGVIKNQARGRAFAITPANLTNRPILAPEWIQSETVISLFWPAPSPKANSSRILEVLAAMLSYRSSLANYRENSITGFSAGIFETPVGSLFRINATVRPGMNFIMARGRVSSIIETYILVRPQKEELDGAKRRLQIGLVNELSDPKSRASRLQEDADRLGSARATKQLDMLWNRVTADDILDVLNRYVVGAPQFAVAQPVRDWQW